MNDYNLDRKIALGFISGVGIIGHSQSKDDKIFYINTVLENLTLEPISEEEFNAIQDLLDVCYFKGIKTGINRQIRRHGL